MQLVPPQNQKAVGNRIKHLRFGKGITQIALADTLGVTPSYVSAIERGKKSVTRKMVDRLIALFEVTEDAILVNKNDQKETENVPLNVPKMSPQSESGGQSRSGAPSNKAETDAQRTQEIAALWSALVHREGLDLTGLHYAGFTSILGIYSDRVLAFLAEKVEGQLNGVLAEHLDNAIDTQQARVKLRQVAAPLNAMQDRILAVDRAIYDMMEHAFQVYPDAMELVKGTVIPVHLMPVTKEMIEDWKQAAEKNRKANTI